MSTTIIRKESNTTLCYGLSLKEFNCSCDQCVATLVTASLLEAYQKLRKPFGTPISISCGYRCPSHNTELSGSVVSRHQLGEAIDFFLHELLQELKTTSKIEERLKECGFTYVEINVARGYVHADTRESDVFKCKYK